MMSQEAGTSGHTTFQSDQGTEFVNGLREEMFAERGWKFRTTSPDTPQMNGKIERNASLVMQSANVLLAHSGLSDELQEQYWPYAVKLACAIRNHMRNSMGVVPRIAAHGNANVNITKLRPFGSQVWCHIPKARRLKGQASAFQGIYLGPSQVQLGSHLVLNTHASGQHTITDSCHVDFKSYAASMSPPKPQAVVERHAEYQALDDVLPPLVHQPITVQSSLPVNLSEPTPVVPEPAIEPALAPVSEPIATQPISEAVEPTSSELPVEQPSHGYSLPSNHALQALMAQYDADVISVDPNLSSTAEAEHNLLATAEGKLFAMQLSRI